MLQVDGGCEPPLGVGEGKIKEVFPLVKHDPTPHLSVRGPRSKESLREEQQNTDLLLQLLETFEGRKRASAGVGNTVGSPSPEKENARPRGQGFFFWSGYA